MAKVAQAEDTDGVSPAHRTGKRLAYEDTSNSISIDAGCAKRSLVRSRSEKLAVVPLLTPLWRTLKKVELPYIF